MKFRPPTIHFYSEDSVLIRFSEKMDPQINRWVHRLSRMIEMKEIQGYRECVPAYSSLLVFFEPSDIDHPALKQQISDLLKAIDTPDSIELDDGLSDPISIPVMYGGMEGPDLEAVAKLHRLHPEEVVQIHTQSLYTVYMIGFSPGFAYMGPLPHSIATPRLTHPRKAVPPGSVGIADRQTGIYPVKSPGGWQILGRTQWVLFDPDRSPPSLLQPGQKVQFYAV